MAMLIKTKRLILRPLDLADVADMTRLIGDIDVSRWLTVVPHPYGLADGRKFIRDIAGEWDLAIEIDGKFAGVIGISDGFGFWLGRPFWGQGYMGEAARALVKLWFTQGHETLTSGYFTGNIASAAIHARLGFVKGAIVQDHSLAQGRNVALQKVSLSRVDWQASHA